MPCLSHALDSISTPTAVLVTACPMQPGAVAAAGAQELPMPDSGAATVLMVSHAQVRLQVEREHGGG